MRDFLHKTLQDEFNPRSLANLTTWLRSDAGITLNGSSVSSWADQSGNGNNATQSNAGSQPSFVQNIIGGRPVVRFTGTGNSGAALFRYTGGQFMTFGTALGKPANFSFFCVFNTDDVSRQQDVFGSSDSGGTNGAIWGQCRIRTSGSGDLGYSFSDGTNLSTGRADSIVSNSTFQVHSQVYTSGQTKVEFRKNKTDQTETTTATASAANSGTAFGFSLGRPGEVNAVYFNGDIAEFIMYSRALDANAILRVETYLSRKYNIW